MKTRTAVVVVLVTAGVLALGFLGVIIIGRLAQRVRTGLASEAARQQMIARWRAPAAFEADRLFPQSVQGRAAGPTEQHPQLTNPALEFPGLRAEYSAADGTAPIEVLVGRPSPTESESIRQRLREAFSGRSGSTSVVRVNNRLRLSSSQPPETIELWDLQGWVFLFRSPADIPPEFIRDYLGAISAPPAPP